nr:MAG TPA: Replication initiation and membrane attachment [Caudoviricetes sp.]
MARPPKMGLDYFPLDVNFLNDLKTKKVVRSYGASAVAVALNLFINIYRDNGYYAQCDDDFIFIISDELKLEEEYVKNVIQKMVDVEFFDKNLYENHKILSSIGIQNRYILASGRRVRSKINPVYDLITPQKEEFMSTETEFMSTETHENDSFCQQEYAKEKKRKEKKEKEIKLKETVVSETDETKNLADEPPPTTEAQKISDVFAFYENHFGMTSAFIQQSLMMWCNDLNPELVKRALEISVEENVLKFRYAQAILQSWANKGIDTLEKAQAESNRHQFQKGNRGGYVENVKIYDNKAKELTDDEKKILEELDNVEEVDF